MNVIRVILAILLPPVGVFFKVGLGLQFWLNIVLTLLGYVPGLVHAIWIIARDDRRSQFARHAAVLIAGLISTS
ncbi:MAG: YqaE/Pmp3 family membrane protein [Thermomicrobiales bacterium]